MVEACVLNRECGKVLQTQESGTSRHLPCYRSEPSSHKFTRNNQHKCASCQLLSATGTFCSAWWNVRTLVQTLFIYPGHLQLKRKGRDTSVTVFQVALSADYTEATDRGPTDGKSYGA